MKPRNPGFPVKREREQASANGETTKVPNADADHLIRSAHRVLVHYLPGLPLPSDLFRVRAMLDAHMFGRDKRTQRDDVVRVARQIDSWHAQSPANRGETPRRLKSE